jgi:hypothetical protein
MSIRGEVHLARLSTGLMAQEALWQWLTAGAT